MKQIIVKPLSAQLTRNTEVLSQMDPYCVCTLGTQKDRTKTKDEAGFTPTWADVLSFNPPKNDITVLYVQVWDEDPTTDDLVGAGTIDIQSYLGSNDKAAIQKVNLYYQGVPAGQILLDISVRIISHVHS